MSKKKNVKQRKCPTNVQLFSKMTVRNVCPSVRPSLTIKQCIWRVRLVGIVVVVRFDVVVGFVVVGFVVVVGFDVVHPSDSFEA